MQKTEQSLPGLIVASYGQRGILELDSGERIRYRLKGRKLRAVCGDFARWSQPPNDDEALVHQLLPRRNSLARPNSRGDAEILASNLDQILVVSAPAPAPDFFLIDRFLCAAELLGITASVIRNKSDLPATADDEFSNYLNIGYTVLNVSAQDGTGMLELEKLMASGVSMLVGQSGVGKSSLINKLVPDANVNVAALSDATSEGKHTTTASLMHVLASGGRLIDSPGVREFAPIIEQQAQIQTGFREILALADNCRFSDCRHLREPSCAVKEAVAAQLISERRYASYKRLHNSTAAVTGN
jgi:ribosome biogenesis GTPase